MRCSMRCEAKELKPTLLGPARLSKLRLHPDPADGEARAQSHRRSRRRHEPGEGRNHREAGAGDREQAGQRRERQAAVHHDLRHLPQAQRRGQGSRPGARWHGRARHARSARPHHRPEPRGRRRASHLEHRAEERQLRDRHHRPRKREVASRCACPAASSRTSRSRTSSRARTPPLSLMPEGLEALGADALARHPRLPERRHLQIPRAQSRPRLHHQHARRAL